MKRFCEAWIHSSDPADYAAPRGYTPLHHAHSLVQYTHATMALA